MRGPYSQSRTKLQADADMKQNTDERLHQQTPEQSWKGAANIDQKDRLFAKYWLIIAALLSLGAIVVAAFL